MVTTTAITRTIPLSGNAILPPAPIITSALTASSPTGQAFTYQITATNNPTNYNATGLPNGLSINTTTGLISGTPTVDDVFNTTISATNASDTDTETLLITITLAAPVITSSTTASGSTGRAFTYQITATNNPTSFSATGLPAGLNVNAITGLISGMPTADGVYTSRISATNATATVTESVVITISASVPVITSATTSNGSTGQAFKYQIEATNNPTNFNATGLPVGLSVNVTDGLISGTPEANGSFSVTLQATNTAGSASQTLGITISSVLPKAQNLTMNVLFDTPTTIDIAPFISGPFISGIRIITAPRNGIVTVSGTLLTYTLTTNVGNDSFTYVAFNNDGDSSPATISVSVTGRPDPSVDPTISSLLSNNMETAKRFSRSQISNIHRRMESLHRSAVSGAVKNTRARLKESRDVQFFAQKLINATQSGNVNLSYNSDRNKDSSRLVGETGVWVEGSVRFGDREKTSDSEGLSFTTDGISAGIDRRFTDKLTLGVSIGYAHSNTTIGTDGSKTDSSGSSISLYGSYQPTAYTFVDGMLGYGELRHDSNRFVTPAGGFARGRFKGNQLFASVAVGYEFNNYGVLISPYGRLDISIDRIRKATETGVGLFSLTYSEEDRTSIQFSLGVRAEAQHKTNFGWARPHMRVELRRESNEDFNSTVRYADQLAGPRYSISIPGADRNALLIGLGSDFVFRNGLKIGFEYQDQRSFRDNINDQNIRLWFDKELNGKRDITSWGSSKSFKDPVQVETGYVKEDNLNRAADGSGNKLSDDIFRFSVSKSAVFPLGRHTRMIARGILSGEKFHTFEDLDNVSAGMQGEFQYRSSGHIIAPTWGLFVRARYENYDSELRSGVQYAFGMNIRQALSDKIFAFAALTRNIRNAEHDVFDTKDYSAKFSINYSLGRHGSMYFGGEFRRGDIVTSDLVLIYGGLADVITKDDGYRNHTLFASRYEAETKLLSLGYNLPLGSRDSIDISWRRIEAEPVTSYEDTRYTVNQYSLSYLIRF